jgi:cytochrome c oxidase subunit II
MTHFQDFVMVTLNIMVTNFQNVMKLPDPKKPKEVLIVSSHPLFGKGIRRLLQSRPDADVIVVGLVNSVDEAMDSLELLNPDLVIVDYDDHEVNRDEFLARFVESEKQLRVVLLSLKEGGSEALVYDRRTLAASQIDDWLSEWTNVEKITLMRPDNIVGNNRQEEGRQYRRSNMKHAIGTIIIVAILTVIGILVLNNDFLLPPPASVQAGPIDNLFSLELKAIAFLFALIVGIMIYSIVVFRRRKGDDRDGTYIKGSSRLEFTWTLLPLIMVIALSMIGSVTLADTMRMDPRALEVRVVGQQWSWRFEYPEQGIISEELVLPVHKQTLLRLTSIDVIHSFWVPEFRVKQDALPGTERELRITPNKLGSFTLMCAEMCGAQHAYMNSDVTVMTEAEFDQWVSDRLTSISDDPVIRGQNWYSQYGCNACHSLDGTRLVGPTFFGLYGHDVELDDGTTVNADDEYLFNSIRRPGEQIVAGYQNLMPQNISDEMTDEQINDVIEFIKTLK